LFGKPRQMAIRLVGKVFDAVPKGGAVISQTALFGREPASTSSEDRRFVVNHLLTNAA
jgi:hypothetical protein